MVWEINFQARNQNFKQCIEIVPLIILILLGDLSR